MPANRYFAPTPLTPGSEILLSDTEWHHLSKVLRNREGDLVELINGLGQLAEGEVIGQGRLRVTALLEEAPLPPSVTLVLALQRMHHLEWAIEKGTELGASAFWLFPGQQSEKTSLSSNQQERLHHLTLAATKQCGRLHLPSIDRRPPLLDWETLPGMLLTGSLSKEAPYLGTFPLEEGPLFFLVGPEKGLSLQEKTFLKERLSAKEVRLHPHILRAETAPLVALSLLYRNGLASLRV